MKSINLYVELLTSSREIKLKYEDIRHLFQFVQTSALKKKYIVGFPGGSVVKNPPVNAGGTGSIPGPGRSYMP